MNIIKLASVSLVLALCSIAAQANSINYSFSTDSSPFGDPTLSPFFSGQSVTGTFIYNDVAPASITVPGGPIAGSTVYLRNTSDLFGAVGGDSFSDPLGRTIVGDNRFGGTLDILSLTADPALDSGAPASAFGLIGFNIDGFSLVNVRMFWIEGQLGITDFLSNQDLPSVLPSFQGRLALDFTPTNAPGPLSSVFFNGFTVRQVPEPATLSLFGLGLLGLAFSRRRHRA